MSYVLLCLVLLALFLPLAFVCWHLEMREREMRLTEVALEASRLLDASLEKRLDQMEEYRHDLAALVQGLDMEQVRAAEEEPMRER